MIIFDPAAAGDAGGALGAALALWYVDQKNERLINKHNFDSMNGSYLGPEYTQEQIKIKLKLISANFEIYNYDELIDKVSEYLSKGKIIGWFQGRMEFDLEFGCTINFSRSKIKRNAKKFEFKN